MGMWSVDSAHTSQAIGGPSMTSPYQEYPNIPKKKGPPKGFKRSLEFCVKQSLAKMGEKNPNWKGGAARIRTGRTRAERLYLQIGSCTSCGSPKTERHHRDDNTLNNSLDNVAILCRRCHMAEDGRLEKFYAMARRKKDTCKYGHPMSGDNLYIWKGQRSCKSCSKERAKKWEALNRPKGSRRMEAV